MIEPYLAKKSGEAHVWAFFGDRRIWVRNSTELYQYGATSTDVHTIDASATLWQLPTIGPLPPT